MTVTECDVPPASVLERARIEAAYFRNYLNRPSAARQRHKPLSRYLRPLAKMDEAHADRPQPHRGALRTGGAGSQSGLNTGSGTIYAVGDKIGPWPIFALSERELIAGRDNKHMDFRLSLMKVNDGGTTSVVVSTVCNVHNVFGKVYLFFIGPFHRYGVRKLMANAIAAGRL